MDLKKIKYCYFLGIGGIGMSALARYFNAMGKEVSGYDKTSTTLTAELEAEGITIHFDEDLLKIPAGVREPAHMDEVLVVYTPAVPSTHLELEFFRSGDFHLKKRAEVLGLITAQTYTVAIAGTHGKTTTSSLTAHILRTAGVECSAFLGGISQNYGTNLLLSSKLGLPGERYAEDNIVVAEADEFDRSFLWLYPTVAVITSVDADHLDIYGDSEEMLETYRQFAMQVRPGGKLVTRPKVKEQLELESEKILTYDVDDAGAAVHARNVRIEDGAFRYDIVTPSGIIDNVTIGTPGRHNVENSLAATAAAQQLNVSGDAIRKALATFRGAKRRFDYRVRTSEITYIDDYAHHPEELRAAISAARQLYPDKKITGIFQPHLFSRTRDFMDGFAESLGLLDEVFLMEIYPAREKPIPGITSSVLLDKISAKEKRLVQKTELVDQVVSGNVEVLLTLGAGDIDLFVEPLQHALEKKFNLPTGNA